MMMFYFIGIIFYGPKYLLNKASVLVPYFGKAFLLENHYNQLGYATFYA